MELKLAVSNEHRFCKGKMKSFLTDLDYIPDDIHIGMIIFYGRY